MAAGKQLAKVAMSSNKPKGKVLEAEDDEFTPRKGPETGGEFEPASKDDFTQQPEVVNGASDLMVEVFGKIGSHSRFAVGSNSLPRGVVVEVEAIAEIH